MTPPVADQTPQTAQARSAAYTLIAFGLRYPDRALIDTLADPRKWMDWPDVLRAVAPRIAEPLQAVRAEVDALAGGSDGEPCELQERHDDLFGHAVRGQCPTYEMEYGGHEIIRQASDLADLAGFYRAFGLEFADGANGRPDHVTAECEFMSVVCAAEARALATGDDENVTVCADAERTFLRDHLARWLPAFAHRVEEVDPSGFYRAIVRFADVFVAAECDRFGVRAGPQTLELGPTDPVLDREISCGSADCGAESSGDRLVQLNASCESDPEP